MRFGFESDPANYTKVIIAALFPKMLSYSG